MKLTQRISIALLTLASLGSLGGSAAAQQASCGVAGCTEVHVGLSTTYRGHRIGIQYQSGCGTNVHYSYGSYRAPRRYYRGTLSSRRPVVYRRPYYEYRPVRPYRSYRRPVCSY